VRALRRHRGLPAKPTFARWLTTRGKVAAIPLSAFYQDGRESGIVRFCFAKQDSTLHMALDRLTQL
jgi:methionine aminotransferase